MPPSRHRLLAVLFLAAAPCCVAPGRAANAEARSLSEAILEKNDPAAAAAFLADDAAQAALKSSDAQLYERVFARAAELKDLRELLETVVSGARQPNQFRLGLEVRHCSFCQESPRLLAWAIKHVPEIGKAERFGSYWPLRVALWDWETLSDEQRAFLSIAVIGPYAWSNLKLPERRQKLKPFADQQLEQLLGQTPWNARGLDAFERRAEALRDLLTAEQGRRLLERVDRLKTAARSIAEAENRLGAAGAQELKAKLEQAKKASDLDARLALLSQVFDGLAIKSEPLLGAAPALEGQSFGADASLRATVAAALRVGLLRAMRGNSTGEEIAQFYSRQGPDLRLGRKPVSGVIGWYEDDSLWLNESYIEEYVRAKGRSLKDLLAGSELLGGLVSQLSSAFVHEATHQRQLLWARELGLQDLYGLHVELEALQVDSLFVAEQLRKVPGFRADLERDALSSLPAREALSKGERLLSQGPSLFRAWVEAYYPDRLSLEAEVSKQMSWLGRFQEQLEAELGRRAKLSPDKAAALERETELTSAPPLEMQRYGGKQWRELLRARTTSALQRLRDQARERRETLPRLYAAYRDRLAAVNASTERRLNELLTQAEPIRPEPPPPVRTQ